MRKLGMALSCAGMLVIAGCQSGPMTYERIGYGPDLEVARAQCEIGAMGVEQGIVAWGSPSYVAGAQIGNAIGNAIRQQQFIKNCMTIQGWRQMPVTTSGSRMADNSGPAAKQGSSQSKPFMGTDAAPSAATVALIMADGRPADASAPPKKFPGLPDAPNRAPKPAGPSGF